MANGTNYIPYNLYVDSGHTYPWSTGATNSTCTTTNDCYLGTGSGGAQSIPVYGVVPTVTTAPTSGSYSDTVNITVTY
jgi:spore coat protein U-like protein